MKSLSHGKQQRKVWSLKHRSKTGTDCKTGKLKDLQKELASTTSEAAKKQEASQSRIKELEKEVSRIAAQYQKENERKEKAWQQEKKALEEEVDELKDEIESITLDKDLAEESRMEMEQELDTLHGKMEILEAQEAARS